MAPFRPDPDDGRDLDRQGSWWQDRDRMAEANPRGGDDTRPLLRCPMCFKDLKAREDCAVCGDEESVAA